MKHSLGLGAVEAQPAAVPQGSMVHTRCMVEATTSMLPLDMLSAVFTVSQVLVLVGKGDETRCCGLSAVLR
jgi:hypothetical protein